MNATAFKAAPFYNKLAKVLFILIALTYIAEQTKEILSPLIFSCLFSILLLPLAVFFEKKAKFPRSVASMLSVLLFLASISLIIFIIGTQISNLASDWPNFQQQLSSSIDHVQTWVNSTFHVTEQKQIIYVRSTTAKIMASGTAVIAAMLLSLSSLLLFFIFTFIFTFFFLLYRRQIKRFLIAVFLDENAAIVYDIIEQVQKIIRKYIIGLLIEMGIVATVVSVAFLALGIKYAILLGLITALFNIVPYIGIFTALIISSLITFATATAFSKVILVIITLVATHLTDSNILLPVIVGSKVKINALITVLGVIIGEMIWNIPGMFLSIPVIAVLKIIFDRVESLNPWGIILGDEERKESILAKKLLKKVQPRINRGLD
jgi:predicted PurR-regulated permease PerM